MLNQYKKTFPQFNIVYSKAKLTFGSDLHFFYKKGSPISIHVIIKKGSQFANIPGLAHFFEHMLVAGTEKYPNKSKLGEKIESIGGNFRAYTNKSIIGLIVNFPDENDLEDVICIINEMFNNSLYDEKTIENERGAILTEESKSLSDSKRRLSNMIFKNIYGDSILGFSFLGNRESIKKITRDDIVSFRNNICSNDLLFVVSGDIDFESLKKLIQKKPIILKSGESAHVNISTKINGQNYLDEMDIPSLQVSWVYPIQDSISSEDKITLSILMSLLGRGRTAILTKKLREERGLVYDVSADINFSSNFQYISINTSLSKENMQEAEKIIFEQIRNIKDGLINEELLSHAKNRYEKSLPMYFETVGDMAAFFTEKIVYYCDESLNIDKYLEIYMNITSKDLVRLARKYFKDENRSMFVVGNR